MSLEYYEKVKMLRGDVAMSRWNNLRNFDYFIKHNKDNTYIDTDLKILVLKNNKAILP